MEAHPSLESDKQRVEDGGADINLLQISGDRLEMVMMVIMFVSHKKTNQSVQRYGFFVFLYS
jgi:hypothetical protein